LITVRIIKYFILKPSFTWVTKQTVVQSKDEIFYELSSLYQYIFYE
jgi:hypothetical protein